METVCASGPISSQPLIAGRGTDGELAAEIAEVDVREHRNRDEIQTMLMDGCFPRHPREQTRKQAHDGSLIAPSVLTPFARSLLRFATKLTHSRCQNRLKRPFK
jgi:hypothetical protein